MTSSQASDVNTPPYVDLKRAAELMLDGHPIIFPTETFFALGSRALDADATARVYRAKHRSTARPLPLILGDWEQLDMIAKVHDGLMPLLKRFWPGPLSVILPARLRVPDILTGGTGRVAAGVTQHQDEQPHDQPAQAPHRQHRRQKPRAQAHFCVLLRRNMTHTLCPLPHTISV